MALNWYQSFLVGVVLEVEREIVGEGDKLMKKKKKEENDKGANVWKNQLKGKSKRKGKVERRNMWR